MISLHFIPILILILHFQFSPALVKLIYRPVGIPTWRDRETELNEQSLVAMITISIDLFNIYLNKNDITDTNFHCLINRISLTVCTQLG